MSELTGLRPIGAKSPAPFVRDRSDNRIRLSGLKRRVMRRRQMTMSGTSIVSTPIWNRERKPNRMHRAGFGDSVTVRYRISLEDGTTIESGSCDHILDFVVGDGSVLPGLELAVVGMAPGEAKEEQLSYEWGFGPYRDDLTAEVTEQGFQALGITPYVGLELTIRHESGRLVPVVVTAVMNGLVRLDANHRLAGKTIRLSIELLGIARPASWAVYNGMNGLNGHGKIHGDVNRFGPT